MRSIDSISKLEHNDMFFPEHPRNSFLVKKVTSDMVNQTIVDIRFSQMLETQRSDRVTD